MSTELALTGAYMVLFSCSFLGSTFNLVQYIRVSLGLACDRPLRTSNADAMSFPFMPFNHMIALNLVSRPMISHLLAPTGQGKEGRGIDRVCTDV